uniref:Calmodulin n=1 Tax=Vitrella brassicaformis TaxID=1169539 RepID=A0A7S1PEE7_9ALVE|mmetsp:Transcript_53268/g.134146  ORF Transcript_53268/g.134146 Transcript_53268/m.134146 type:complete len:171 (+) Transcript_53268:67-579(+)
MVDWDSIDEDIKKLLTETQCSIFETAFTLFDRDKDGFIAFSDLPQMWRSVGQNPTDAQLKKIVETWDKDKKGFFDFKTFLRMCISPAFDDPMKEERLLEAFRHFDKDGTGIVTAPQLRLILSAYGEKLPEEEADELVEWAEKAQGVLVSEGRLSYENLIKQLLERDPNIM